MKGFLTILVISTCIMALNSCNVKEESLNENFNSSKNLHAKSSPATGQQIYEALFFLKGTLVDDILIMKDGFIVIPIL